MRILIINYEFPPLGGGGGSFSKNMALELSKNNEVDVVTSHYKGLAKKEKLGNINIYRIPVLNRTSLYNASLLSMLFFPPVAAAKSLMLLIRNKYDLINTHFAIPTGPAGLIVSSLTKTPNVVSVHGSDIYNPAAKYSPHKNCLLKWAVRTVLNKADKVLAQSSDMKKYINKFYSDKDNIEIVPLALPDNEIEDLLSYKNTVREKAVNLISIGRMAKVKGYDFLIRALAILAKKIPDINLKLIGDGPERINLETLAAELDLTDKITFTGWLNGAEKYKELKNSDIYVMSSLHEGFGVVLLEAMACGLPVVCTNKGGQTDIIKDGINGLLSEVSDENSLAEKIYSLIEDKDKRTLFSENNRKDISKYRLSQITKQYSGIFTDIVT